MLVPKAEELVATPYRFDNNKQKAKDFFVEIPRECTADKLIRGVFDASYDPEIPAAKQNISIVLGTVKQSGEITLFSGDQSQINVNIEENDKLIVFSNH